MNINRLRYFLTLKQTESIRKASEILCISPATLSKAIKQLEFEVGHILLVPNGRGITITKHGKELARQAEPLIIDFEKLRKQCYENRKPTFGHRDKKNIIRLGSFEIFTTHFLGELVKSLPDNEIRVHELFPGMIEKSIVDREIDYGITCNPMPQNDISYRRITFTKVQIFGRAGVFTDYPFKKLPFVVPIHEVFSPYGEVTLDGWPQDKERMIKYRVSMLESALAICRTGKAVAFLPTSIIQLHNKTLKEEYHLVPLEYPELNTEKLEPIYFVSRKSDVQNVVMAKIIDSIKNFYSK